MKLPKWLRRTSPSARVHPELPPPTGPLREFVYLDEISVISLVASRRGAVPEAVTRIESARESADLGSKLTANAAAVKAELGSSLSSEATRGVTTVAKSVVQATFKDLLEIEEDRLRLRSPGDGGSLPRVESAEALVRLADAGKHASWTIRASELCRGDAVELSVELEADPLFRANTIITEGLDLIANMLDESGMTVQDMSQMRRLSAILERLLAGLVPLRGRVSDYRLIDVQGTELVVHRRLADELRLPARDLTLVCVASRELFWKDLRRVVFSGSEFTVFSRIGRTGIQRSWSPVKLAEAMQDIVPQFGDQLTQLSSLIQTAMTAGATGQATSGTREAMMREALVAYEVAGASENGESITQSEMEAAGLLSAPQLARHQSPDDWRTSFRLLDDDLRDRFGVQLSAEDALRLRTDALRGVGLLGSSSSAAVVHAIPAVQNEQRLLEVEPVAIYW